MRHIAQLLTVRFDDREVEIEGTPAALRQLAILVPSPDAVSIDLTPGRVDPNPHKGFVRSIVVRPDEHKVRVQRSDDRLLVSGTVNAREVLAANLNDFADGPHAPGDHLHIESFPGHYFLEEGSIPLVVSQPES